MSPFANAVAFTMDTFSITGVSVTLADGSAVPATIAKGGSIQLAAEVSGTGTFNGAVTWGLAGAEQSGTYLMGGTLRVATDETAAGLFIRATSVADPTEYAQVSISIV